MGREADGTTRMMQAMVDDLKVKTKDNRNEPKYASSFVPCVWRPLAEFLSGHSTALDVTGFGIITEQLVAGLAFDLEALGVDNIALFWLISLVGAVSKPDARRP